MLAPGSAHAEGTHVDTVVFSGTATMPQMLSSACCVASLARSTSRRMRCATARRPFPTATARSANASSSPRRCGTRDSGPYLPSVEPDLTCSHKGMGGRVLRTVQISSDGSSVRQGGIDDGGGDGVRSRDIREHALDLAPEVDEGLRLALNPVDPTSATMERHDSPSVVAHG